MQQQLIFFWVEASALNLVCYEIYIISQTDQRHEICLLQFISPRSPKNVEKSFNTIGSKIILETIAIYVHRTYGHMKTDTAPALSQHTHRQFLKQIVQIPWSFRKLQACGPTINI